MELHQVHTGLVLNQGGYTAVLSVNLPNNHAAIIGIDFHGVIMMLAGFCIFAQAVGGSAYKDRKDRYRKTQLLVCEYCNHIVTPDVMDCDNCEASLAGAGFNSDS